MTQTKNPYMRLIYHAIVNILNDYDGTNKKETADKLVEVYRHYRQMPDAETAALQVKARIEER